jgi:hypothetical protein
LGKLQQAADRRNAEIDAALVNKEQGKYDKIKGNWDKVRADI